MLKYNYHFASEFDRYKFIFESSIESLANAVGLRTSGLCFCMLDALFAGIIGIRGGQYCRSIQCLYRSVFAAIASHFPQKMEQLYLATNQLQQLHSY